MRPETHHYKRLIGYWRLGRSVKLYHKKRPNRYYNLKDLYIFVFDGYEIEEAEVVEHSKTIAVSFKFPNEPRCTGAAFRTDTRDELVRKA